MWLYLPVVLCLWCCHYSLKQAESTEMCFYQYVSHWKTLTNSQFQLETFQDGEGEET